MQSLSGAGPRLMPSNVDQFAGSPETRQPPREAAVAETISPKGKIEGERTSAS